MSHCDPCELASSVSLCVCVSLSHLAAVNLNSLSRADRFESSLKFKVMNIYEKAKRTLSCIESDGHGHRYLCVNR